MKLVILDMMRCNAFTILGIGLHSSQPLNQFIFQLVNWSRTKIDILLSNEL